MAISVDYSEVGGWPKEVYSITGFAGERRVTCAWGDRHALAVGLMTPPDNIYPYNSSGALVTHLPNVEGLRKGRQAQGDTADMASYEKAVLTVNYSTFGIATGRTSTGLLITEWTEGWSEHKTLNHAELQWGPDATDDALRPSEGPSKIEPGMDYILMYHSLSSLPAALLTQQGTVNDAVVSSYLLGLSFPTETVQYMSPMVKHRVTTEGSTGYQVRYRFRFKPNIQDGEAKGWNWHWNTAEGKYQQVYNKKTLALVKSYTPATFAF